MISSEEEPVQQDGPDEYVFLGRIDLDDFNEVMDSQVPKGESDTLAGFLYDHFGRVPHDGESLQTDGLLITIRASHWPTHPPCACAKAFHHQRRIS